ncbi:hypothetical protein [Nocardia sp. MH4]|uniref:hypothetical protein n=1 Tax=Nocardia sp. MH4 TaxID=1768677 RepID=UPI001C5012B6|nr:hypothetical protein [Nocardia sp. MH4]
MSATTTTAAARRDAWIAARLAEAPPLNAAQQHVIRRAFAGSEIRRTTSKAAA